MRKLATNNKFGVKSQFKTGFCEHPESEIITNINLKYLDVKWDTSQGHTDLKYNTTQGDERYLLN